MQKLFNLVISILVICLLVWNINLTQTREIQPMASLSEIQQLLQQIRDDLPALINRSQIQPEQIVTKEGLSDIVRRLGLIQTGEFRAGNGVEPGLGFSGIRTGYPSFSYNSELWNLAGVSNDILQAGMRASDGTIWAGAGALRMTASGLLVYNGAAQTGAIEPDGDVRFGSNLSSPSTTSFQVFSTAQTYNGESMGAGDILIGDNSTGNPNVLWDSSTSELKLRLGTIVTNKMSSSSLSNSGAKIARSTNQTISDVTNTYIQFDVEVFDDDNYVDLGTDNTKITFSRTGTYLVGFNLSWNDLNVGPHLTNIIYNNGQALATVKVDATMNFPSDTSVALVNVTAGDYIQLRVRHNTGASKDVSSSTTANAHPTLWIMRQR